MRYLLIGVSIVLLLVGAVWTLQGLNVIKGSFMTGQAFWGWTGVVCLIAGLAVLLGSFRGFAKR